MKIDLELKTGTDKEVVSSLRKIVGLPIGYEQRVELAKRLVLDYITAEGNPAPKPAMAANDSGGWVDIGSLIDTERLNTRSRLVTTRACSIRCMMGKNSLLGQREQIEAARLLIDVHWFAWASYCQCAPMLMAWPSRLGTPPELSSAYTLLTDWSLEVPPVPSI